MPTILESYITISSIVVSVILLLQIIVLLYALVSKFKPLNLTGIRCNCPNEMPLISILIPTYREGQLISQLFDSLHKLNYPMNKLQVILALEPDDDETIKALKEAAEVLIEENGLPLLVRYRGLVMEVVYNESGVKTKPAALNQALKKVRGSIVAVYDAEDQPHPEHPLIAVRILSDDNVAAVQFTRVLCNPHENSLTKAQDAEFYVWYMHIEPTIAELTGLPAIAGSAYYIRKSVLDEIGGWDSKSPTEDLDLTFKLARRGYNIIMANPPAVTQAVSELKALVAQRARWIRGALLAFPSAIRALPRSGLVMITTMLLPLAGIIAQTWFLLPLFSMGVDAQLLVAPMIFSIFSYILMMKLSSNPSSSSNGRYIPLLAAVNALAAWRALIELLVCPYRWNKTPHTRRHIKVE